MINVGVSKVICHCGQELERTGGVFGGDKVIEKDTYYCSKCKGYILVLIPNERYQREFDEDKRTILTNT